MAREKLLDTFFFVTHNTKLPYKAFMQLHKKKKKTLQFKYPGNKTVIEPCNKPQNQGVHVLTIVK